MASYKAPGVEVIQQFETSPSTVSIEAMPSVAVGTAYDVYNKQKLGSFNGIGSSVGASGGRAAFDFVVDGTNKPIWSEGQGSRIYNFYPPKMYVRDSSDLSDTELVVDDSEFFILASGFKVSYTSSFIKQAIANTTAYFPFFKNENTTVTIDDVNDKKVTCDDGRFVDAGLISGQQVVYYSSTDHVLGTIDYVESNTVLYLKNSAAYTTDGTKIYIGCGTVTEATVASIVKTKPAFIYDKSTNFNRLGITRGDIINVTASGLATQTDYASIIGTPITDNLIEIYTGTGLGETNYDLLSGYAANNFYGSSSSNIDFTVNITEYEIRRFVGFAEKVSTLGITGATVNPTVTASESGTTVYFDDKEESITRAVGDTIQIATALDGDTPTTVSASYTLVSGSGLTFTLDRPFTTDTNAHPYRLWRTSDSLTVINNQITADYRAVKVDNLLTVFKSSDTKLVGSNSVFGQVNVFNELAFIINTILGSNGGRVVYAASVDPTLGIVDQYTQALEALKFYDVYSHAIGTTEAGVNAMVPSYLDEQSDPYEGHERIASLAYDEDDVYKLGEAAGGGTPVSTTGLVTIASGSINLQTIGIGLGDVVRFYEDSVGWHDAIVTASPASSTTVDTDWVSDSGPTVVGNLLFITRTKSKQANRIASLGTGNRRATVIWPGTFYADTTAAGTIPAMTNVKLPAYYLSALVVGLDGGQKVSQSFTRLITGVPGLSNIQLKTNSYFRKAELDTIAAGGIDILVQANPITNTIYSRHDLTSNMDAVEYRERSITKQADSAAKTIRTALDPYIGKYNVTPQLLKFLGSIMTVVSNTIVKNGVLSGLSVDKIQRDPNIADKINILVTATVFVAGNYYEVTMTVVSR